MGKLGWMKWSRQLVVSFVVLLSAVCCSPADHGSFAILYAYDLESKVRLRVFKKAGKVWAFRTDNVAFVESNYLDGEPKRRGIHVCYDEGKLHAYFSGSSIQVAANHVHFVSEGAVGKEAIAPELLNRMLGAEASFQVELKEPG